MSREALRGLTESLPLLPSHVAWGMVFGAAASAAGLSPGASTAMSAVAWSGTAQMSALGLLGQPVVVIFGTSLLLSLRFVPMSLVLAARFSAHPRWRRALLGCLLADAGFALLTRVRSGGAGYLVGVWVVLYSSWLIGTALGAFAAPLLPAGLTNLSDALVGAIFAVLAVQACTSRKAALTALASALIVLGALLFLSPGLAILAAAALAAGAGAVLRR
jgi:predicted branched-subunit amino acid permease